jgi:hypothetical protein
LAHTSKVLKTPNHIGFRVKMCTFAAVWPMNHGNCRVQGWLNC